MAQEHSKQFLRRHLLLRVVYGRWRLFSCLALGLVIGLLTPASFDVATRLLIGWNAGGWPYLFLSMPHAGASGETIRRRAILQDERFRANTIHTRWLEQDLFAGQPLAAE